MSYSKTPIRADGKRAIIYLRVSTEEQVDNFSLDTQEAICRKEAEKRGYEVAEIFREEGRSAKSILGRPVLISLLEYSRKNKNKVHALFVYRLDRISRVTADYLAIRKKLGDNGVTIISSTEPTGDSPTEKLVETILAGFAQLDNDIRGERARNGMRARFLSGKVMSNQVQIGYCIQAGYTVKDPQKWEKVKKAWDLMATGTKSLREITNLMNEWGLRIKFNGREFPLRVQRAQVIFRSKFYMGVLASKTYKEEVKGTHVPMITEEQYYKVQAILDGRNVNQLIVVKRKHNNMDFPLRRIIKCASCGVGLTAGWSKGRHTRYGYYRCSNSQCNTISIKPEELESSLIALLKGITPTTECLNLFIHFMYETYHTRQGRLQKIKNEADTEITKLKELRKLLVEKNISGVYSDEIFKEHNAIIEDKITKAQISKDEVSYENYNIEAINTFIRTLLADLGETYKRSSTSQLKVLLGSIFPSGLAWSYNGTLNHSISPIYQAILNTSDDSVLSGEPGGTRTHNRFLKRELLYH
jgi:site-specific DNA recombinase